MVYLLYYGAVNKDQWQRWAWIVEFAGRFGVYPAMVDLEKLFRRKNTHPFNFRTLEEALADPIFDGFTWVWLDANGTTYVDEFAHPVDNVIYCIGHDASGFQKVEAAGPRIKIRFPRPAAPGSDSEYWASTVASMVLNDRAMYIAGKRS